MPDHRDALRIAAIADIHYTKTSQGALLPLLAQISETADVLLVAGDFTDTGLPEEAHVLAKDLAAGIKIPVIGVLGNHDYESSKQEEVQEILCDAGASILEGESCQIRDVGFVGIKGFGGGFDRQALQAWGEQAIKNFVQEAVGDALRLESALSLLKTEQRIALLHYSPIRTTVQGENPEIFPFLGSSRLEEPINRFQVTAVFHGHAHAGTPEGKTKVDIPVYNVSQSVLRHAYPDRPPFRLLEIPIRPSH
ncbi:MAG: metallophosphoesterase [Chloroflexi bacterium]|nr:metallophosphoesterase [Chloroflexota bacterium]